MQAETLDVLEKAEIPAPQARAIARAIDMEIAASRQSLATRADVLLESGTLRTAMSELKSSLEAKFSSLETKFSSLETKFSSLETKFGSLETKFGSLETKFGSLEAKFSSQETTFSSLETKVGSQETRFSSLETKIEVSKSEVLNRMYAALMAQLALLLGLAYFFVSRVS